MHVSADGGAGIGLSWHITAPVVRRALAGLREIEPDGAVWRGLVGAPEREVRVELEGLPDGRNVVHASSRMATCDALTPVLARILLREHDGLVFGRFLVRAGFLQAEHTILAGHTMDHDEVQHAVTAVAWAAGAYAGRVQSALAGHPPSGPPPTPPARELRGVDDMLVDANRRVETLLGERYGVFERDPNWGLHAAFGSARVFVAVRHYTGRSASVIVHSPVLLGVEASDALAFDAQSLADARQVGRFVHDEERNELWLEHALLADDLQAQELTAVIDAIAAIADASDDRLQAAHGGRRYRDVAGA